MYGSRALGSRVSVWTTKWTKVHVHCCSEGYCALGFLPYLTFTFFFGEDGTPPCEWTTIQVQCTN